MFRDRRFAFEGHGPDDWEGWTPPWMRHEWRERGERGARILRARMRRGLFGPEGPFGPGPEHEHEHGHHEHGHHHHGHGPGRHFREGNRFFGRGDVKFALLELLQERPMHGYEMMKALEERSGGFYTPSAGTIYPTLQMLEDRGLVTFQELEGKKVYSITDEGKAFLGERQKEEESFVPPWAREFGRRWNVPEMQALRSEAAEVARLFAIAGRKSFQNPEQVAQLRSILARSRQELTDLIYGTPQTNQPQTPTEPEPPQQ